MALVLKRLNEETTGFQSRKMCNSVTKFHKIKSQNGIQKPNSENSKEKKRL